MKNTKLFASLLASAMLFSASIASAQTAPVQALAGATATAGASVDDATITSKVKASLGGAKVDVSSSNGLVVLSGSVASADEAARLVQAASSIDGVKQVKNSLTVGK